MKARTKAALEGRNAVSALNEMFNRWTAGRPSSRRLPRQVGGGEDGEPGKAKKYEAAIKASRDLNKKVKELKDKVYNRDVQRDTPSDTLHFHTDFQGKATRVGVGSGRVRRGAAARRARRDSRPSARTSEAYLAQFNALVDGRRAGVQQGGGRAGVPTLFVGDPIAIVPAGF